MAGVIGHTFDLSLLAYLLDQDVVQALETLRPALFRNLIWQTYDLTFTFVYLDLISSF